jgi:hypothetical protein
MACRHCIYARLPCCLAFMHSCFPWREERLEYCLCYQETGLPRNRILNLQQDIKIASSFLPRDSCYLRQLLFRGVSVQAAEERGCKSHDSFALSFFESIDTRPQVSTLRPRIPTPRIFIPFLSCRGRLVHRVLHFSQQQRPHLQCHPRSQQPLLLRRWQCERVLLRTVREEDQAGPAHLLR